MELSFAKKGCVRVLTNYMHLRYSPLSDIRNEWNRRHVVIVKARKIKRNAIEDMRFVLVA